MVNKQDFQRIKAASPLLDDEICNEDSYPCKTVGKLFEPCFYRRFKGNSDGSSDTSIKTTASTNKFYDPLNVNVVRSA